MNTTKTIIEKPIIFSGPMVRAILDGRKTQTRRIIRPDYSWVRYYEGNRKEAFEAFHRDSSRPWNPWRGGRGPIPDGEPTHQWQSGDEPLPQNYQKGMHLWVRETFREISIRADGGSFRGIQFEDKQAFFIISEGGEDNPCFLGDPASKGFVPTEGMRWKSSLRMPKWASRITLEITDVRVQRVQDISEEDALAEGCFLRRCSCDVMKAKPKTPIESAFRQTACHIHGEEFSYTWDRINGNRASWEMNPWVFAITFRKVEA